MDRDSNGTWRSESGFKTIFLVMGAGSRLRQNGETACLKMQIKVKVQANHPDHGGALH
jgi:hypothetical protein